MSMNHEGSLDKQYGALQEAAEAQDAERYREVLGALAEPWVRIDDSPIQHDGVARFVDGVDRVLNSNTFLLCFDSSVILTSWTTLPLLHVLSQQGWVARAMVEQDQARDEYWSMNSNLAYLKLTPGSLVVEGFSLSGTPLDDAAFKAKLLWMLTTPRSWYKKQLTEEQAQPLVETFLRALVGGSDPRAWRFLNLAPDFFHSSWGSLVTPDNQHFAYFDGMGMDHCLVAWQPDRLYMLLTNGCD